MRLVNSAVGPTFALALLVSCVGALIVVGCSEQQGTGSCTGCDSGGGASSGGATATGAGGTAGATTSGSGGSGGSGGATASPTLRIMTFNIKHGDISSLEAIADVIKAETPDVVGLQEVDVDADRSGNVDQPHRLSQLTGMASVFQSALTFSSGGYYGVALLSRFPIISSSKVQLTSSGEQRILAIVDVEIEDGWVVPISVTHMGLGSVERQTQAQEIVDELSGEPDAIVMGDINEELSDPAGLILAEAFTDGWDAGTGPGHTIPVNTPTRRIDVVLLPSSWPAPSAAHVVSTPASDHLPVVVTVPLPTG